MYKKISLHIHIDELKKKCSAILSIYTFTRSLNKTEAILYMSKVYRAFILKVQST